MSAGFFIYGVLSIIGFSLLVGLAALHTPNRGEGAWWRR